MDRFLMEVSVNGFKLFTHRATYEETCLNRCRRYMNEFQRKVANVPMKVAIYEKTIQKENWQYKILPYEYKKTLLRKPLRKKSDVEAAKEPEE